MLAVHVGDVLLTFDGDRGKNGHRRRRSPRAFRVAGHRIASGASARMIADQLGQSRVSMSLDFYLGRRAADPRVLAALEGADRAGSSTKVMTKVMTLGSSTPRDALSLVREPTGDSNPQPPVYKTGALPIAPRRPTRDTAAGRRNRTRRDATRLNPTPGLRHKRRRHRRRPTPRLDATARCPAGTGPSRTGCEGRCVSGR